jgi:hypothetical protein
MAVKSPAVQTFGAASQHSARGAHCLLPSASCLLFLVNTPRRPRVYTGVGGGSQSPQALITTLAAA